MQYKDFEDIANNLIEQNKLSYNIYNIIRPEAFDNLYEVINILLKEFYTEIGNDIFFDYVYGENRGFIEIDSKEYKCESIEDLYKIMENFKL